MQNMVVGENEFGFKPNIMRYLYTDKYNADFDERTKYKNMGYEYKNRVDEDSPVAPLTTCKFAFYFEMMEELTTKFRAYYMVAVEGKYTQADELYFSPYIRNDFTYTGSSGKPTEDFAIITTSLNSKAFTYTKDGKTVTYMFGGYSAKGSDFFKFVPRHKVGEFAWYLVFGNKVPATDDPYASIDGSGDLPGGENIAIPNLPPIGATTTGVLGLFAPSSSQMQALSDYMWTDFGGKGADVTEVLKEIVEALKRSISNPLDYISGLSIIPSQGLSVGGSSEVRFGFTGSGVSMPRLTSQYFIVDCGALTFNEVCGGTFLDYAPYSKFSIYLPYIGIKQVDANDFVGHTIGVVYHGDVVTGGLTAFITKDGSVMYQYSGCCALNVPLSADSWGTTISGAVNVATAIGMGAVTGGPAGATTAAALGASAVASNPSQLAPQVDHSGATSGGAGAMGVQHPFIIRESVSFHSTNFFNTVTGYPSYYYKRLADVHGFTTVLDIHLSKIQATQDELNEIEKLLKDGVILP